MRYQIDQSRVLKDLKMKKPQKIKFDTKKRNWVQWNQIYKNRGAKYKNSRYILIVFKKWGCISTPSLQHKSASGLG